MTKVGLGRTQSGKGGSGDGNTVCRAIILQSSEVGEKGAEERSNGIKRANRSGTCHVVMTTRKS
jgi:hypothetical protein